MIEVASAESCYQACDQRGWLCGDRCTRTQHVHHGSSCSLREQPCDEQHRTMYGCRVMLSAKYTKLKVAYTKLDKV